MTQSAFGSSLNHRPIRHRIAERHAELDHRRADSRQFNDQLACRFQIRIAGGDEGNEAFLPFLFQPRERFGNSGQNIFTTEDPGLFRDFSVVLRVLCGYYFFSCSRTVSTSLSPRPDRLMITICSLFISRATFKACATACADSNAGMMPSNF